MLSNSLEELSDLVTQLRDPQKGCKWNIEKDKLSLIPYLLEEAHELADALRNDKDEEVIDELGDLLLQILLHSQIAKEEEKFSLKTVINTLYKKIIRRNPHVFGKKILETSDQIHKQWESIKDSESKEDRSSHKISKKLRKVIRCQPALAASLEISIQTAERGFDWKNVNEIWKKFYEEIKEFEESIINRDYNDAQIELGDIIFTLVNIARYYKLNPEEGLASANNKFVDRFDYIESHTNGAIAKQERTKLKELWQDAKIYINDS